ncbi:hypothetical protein LR48_Vigan08g046500 [Vigna angularis]|uniref:Uncharacterized protein n=1 Tax=Phaseolus angularis TaxID=3914 RepID=A0A0L9V3L8_PHAAN|nr:hypothetical protein LR48_Vigan08g046500 [Vigna angularis]
MPYITFFHHLPTAPLQATTESRRQPATAESSHQLHHFLRFHGHHREFFHAQPSPPKPLNLHREQHHRSIMPRRHDSTASNPYLSKMQAAATASSLAANSETTLSSPIRAATPPSNTNQPPQDFNHVLHRQSRRCQHHQQPAEKSQAKQPPEEQRGKPFPNLKP